MSSSATLNLLPMKRVFATLCLTFLTTQAFAQADPDGRELEQPQVQGPSAQAEVADADSARVLVVGQRRGPGLWKVSRNGHVLWVFGTYAPLPKNMKWRSQQVEAILAGSQEFIGSPLVNAEVGFFRSLTLLPFTVGVTRNPDGRQLRDLLPADLYARWLLLKLKYIGADDSIERERPYFAAEALYQAALSNAGFSSGGEIQSTIEKMVKKYKVVATFPKIELETRHPVRMIKEFKNSRIDDAACFALTLERLESDLEAMRSGADAWAIGDLAAIRKLNHADRDAICTNAMFTSEFMQQRTGSRPMELQLLDKWVAAAEKALAANASTFAILPIRHILNPNGYLAALEAKGYRVDSPE